MSSNREAVKRAEALAARLRDATPPVKRSTFLDLVEGSGGERRELLRRLDLAVQGEGGHLGRTGSYAEQLLDAARVLRDALAKAGDLEAREIATWLGWTARLLYVDEKLPAARAGGGHGGGGGRRTARQDRPSPGQRGRLPGDPVPSDRKPIRSSKLGLSGSQLGELAELKKRLENGNGGADD